jgi:hypothetical protein
MQTLLQAFDFPDEVRSALLAALVLLVPLTAQLIAAYFRLQLNSLREQLEANTRLTQQALAEIQEHNENCTGSPTERAAPEVS